MITKNPQEEIFMKKVTFAILGMGNRGTAYASKLLKYPETGTYSNQLLSIILWEL